MINSFDLIKNSFIKNVKEIYLNTFQGYKPQLFKESHTFKNFDEFVNEYLDTSLEFELFKIENSNVSKKYTNVIIFYLDNMPKEDMVLCGMCDAIYDLQLRVINNKYDLNDIILNQKYILPEPKDLINRAVNFKI